MSRISYFVMSRVSAALMLLIMFLAALTGAAASAPVADKSTADSLYAAKQYEAAAKQYAVLADSLQSADLYYNLGNAQYKLKQNALAVLAYERALRLDPDNEDAQYNLALVRTNLADRFSKPSEMFFVSWFRSWVTTHSVGHWTWLSFLWIVLFFVALILYFIGPRMWQRKSGFFVTIFCLLCFLLTTIFAIVQRCKFSNNSDAIIMVEEVQLFTSPSASSKQIRLLHEGTKVSIHDLTKDGWLLVELPDASEGYLKNPPGVVELVVPSAK